MNLDTQDSFIIEVELRNGSVDNGTLRIIIDASDTSRDAEFIAEGIGDMITEFFKRCNLDITKADVN